MESLESLLQHLEEACPLVGHTAAGRLFSAVRRMKMERELGIPIAHRTPFVISVTARAPANELDQSDWEELYRDLSARLQGEFPELHGQLSADCSIEPIRSTAGTTRLTRAIG